MPGPSAPSTQRRARRRQARLDQIRAAASEVFARQGHAGATMADVARAADLGKASLYHYFPTKQALLADLVGQGADRLGAAVRARLAQGGEPWQVLQDVFGQALDLFREDPLLVQVSLPLIAAGEGALEAALGPEAAERVRVGHAPLYQAVATAAGAAHEPALVPLLATVLIGLAHKTLHGPVDLRAETDLLFRLLRNASCSD